MRVRISKISLMVCGTSFLLSGLLLSVPGNYWPWFSVMAGFAMVPVVVGPNRYRLYGLMALICSLLLIFGDIQGGKHFRAKHPLIYGAANSQQTSAAPALNLENKVSTRITGVAATFFPNGESALVMNCETEVPIDDKVNLRKEVDKLWTVFKTRSRLPA